MVLQAGADHFDTANFSVGDLEGFGNLEAGGAIEDVAHGNGPAIGQRDVVDRAVLIEDHVGPNDAALFVNDRKRR